MPGQLQMLRYGIDTAFGGCMTRDGNSASKNDKRGRKKGGGTSFQDPLYLNHLQSVCQTDV